MSTNNVEQTLNEISQALFDLQARLEKLEVRDKKGSKLQIDQTQNILQTKNRIRKTNNAILFLKNQLDEFKTQGKGIRSELKSLERKVDDFQSLFIASEENPWGWLKVRELARNFSFTVGLGKFVLSIVGGTSVLSFVFWQFGLGDQELASRVANLEKINTQNQIVIDLLKKEINLDLKNQ